MSDKLWENSIIEDKSNQNYEFKWQEVKKADWYQKIGGYEDKKADYLRKNFLTYLPTNLFTLIETNLFPHSPITLFPSKKVAFTLAEVLITLGIIGIVAAMTLPSLIANYRNKEFATRAKRTYSLINQAIQKYQAEEGVPGDITGLFDTSKTSDEVLTAFSKYFDSPTVCLTYGKCSISSYPIDYASVLYSADNTASNSSMYKPFMILKDGSIIRIAQFSACEWEATAVVINSDGTQKRDENGNLVTNTLSANYCAAIFFDTNGTARPNQYGADAFEIRIKRNGTYTGWSKTGYDSLMSILQGKDPIYTKYTRGAAKE